MAGRDARRARDSGHPRLGARGRRVAAASANRRRLLGPQRVLRRLGCARRLRRVGRRRTRAGRSPSSSRICGGARPASGRGSRRRASCRRSITGRSRRPARLGIPRLEDFNDLDTGAGIAPIPLNAHAARCAGTPLSPTSIPPGLDPTSEVIAETLVDRVADRRGAPRTGLVRPGAGRASASSPPAPSFSASGAYGSPAILLRSGIGPEPALRELGIEPVAGLEGVGANLIEHPGVTLFFEPGDELRDSLAAQHEAGLLFQGQCAIRAASELCEEGLWDLQLLPWASPKASEPVEGPFETHISIFAMKPASRGQVALRSTDPDAAAGGRAAVPERSRRARPVGAARRRSARPRARRDRAARLRARGRGRSGDRDHRARRTRGVGGGERRAVSSIPSAPARWAPHPSRPAVVDERGAVHGIVGLHVADASIMPTIPRANTNLPTTAVADRIAALLASRGSAAI